MDLFVRDSGPVGAPVVVFLHGGDTSGWSWEPVVERLPHYRCLVPDLPQYGNSCEQGPFDMGEAAAAVAGLIRSRVSAGRANLVGFSLGAQVGVQLLASEPKLVDRAVLCGTFINTMPCVRLMQRGLGLLARNTWYQSAMHRYRSAHLPGIPSARIDDFRDDLRLVTGPESASIVMASAGFTLPAGLENSDPPTLLLTGAEEMRLVRRAAAMIAQRMPNGVDAVATGMDHNWPLSNPELFSRTVDGWLSGGALPPEIRKVDAAAGRRRDRSHR